MGLRTTNYEVKKLGITLPQAYAMVKNLHVFGESGYAEMIVQTSRENADKCVKGQLNALEQKRVDFIVKNRDGNDRATAYEAAKKKKTRAVQTGELDKDGIPIEVEVVVDEQFFGWVDDIQESTVNE